MTDDRRGEEEEDGDAGRRGSGPPLLTSFLMVFAGFALSFLAELVAFFLVAWFYFPATFELYTAEPLTTEQLLQNLDVAMPKPLVAISLAFGVAVTAAIGFALFRLSPFGPQGHVVFLAVLLFVAFLQHSLSSPPEVKSFWLLKMLLYPAAALLGGRGAAATHRE